MVEIREILFSILILLLLYNYYTTGLEHTLLYLFLIIFIIFSLISLAVSRKYGAKILGWGSIIKYRDYTSIFINFTQLGIILNVLFVFYFENYQLIMVLIGFVVMLIGMGFNLIVRRELGKNWIPLAKTTEGQELVTSGIYSKIRHPFYTSILILFLGLAVMAWNLYSLLFYALFVSAVIIRIRKEEEDLITKFGGEYRSYREEVPMLLPEFN